jgi:DNA-binding PadR family transcriptional regulator
MVRGVSSGGLTETSYIVLGMLEHLQPATAYDLKRFAQQSTSNFWSLPHTQLYTECARLVDGGLLSEQREEHGRRRRIYSVTARGRDALQAWRTETTSELYELRDVATLKLFFGADPAALAATQVRAHERRLAHYREQKAALAGAPQGWLLALDVGIGHEREFIRFWRGLAGGESG